MKRPVAIAMLLLGLLLPLELVDAGPLRIALLTDTTIQGDTIFLAHLLPSNAPPELRRRAENIALGRAPELGSARAFSRESIQAAIEGGDLGGAEIVVPETVVVRREADTLTKERVWIAFQDAAAARGLIWAANVRPEDIQWAAPVALPAGNSRLEVREVYIDKLLNQVRFRLRISNNPTAPSFYAWCPLPPKQRSQFSERRPAHSQGHSNNGSPSTAELVSVRRVATLHLHSQNSLATLQVRPLQSGELGQTIRVRVPANGHTLVARIAGPDLLDAAF